MINFVEYNTSRCKIINNFWDMQPAPIEGLQNKYLLKLLWMRWRIFGFRASFSKRRYLAEIVIWHFKVRGNICSSVTSTLRFWTTVHLMEVSEKKWHHQQKEKKTEKRMKKYVIFRHIVILLYFSFIWNQ